MSAGTGNVGGRRSPSVTFVEPGPSREGTPQSARMRYSQLFKSMTGGSVISSGGMSEDEINRNAKFDSSLQPARPAMKQSQRRMFGADQYPAVEGSSDTGSVSAAQGIPGTGTTSRTRGGAALISALGADMMAIPPSCPPALPPAAPSAGSGLGWGVRGPLAAPFFTGANVPPNPFAVAELPRMPAVVPSSDGSRIHMMSRSSSGTMPLVAVGAGAASHSGTQPGPASRPTVSDDDAMLISSPGSHCHYAPSEPQLVKPASQDSSPNGIAHVEVQLPPIKTHLPKPQAYSPQPDVHTGYDQDGTWQHIQPGPPGSVSSSSVAGGTAAAGPPADDDGASSGIIVPPGSQEPLPPFWSQLTFRAVFVGLLVGFGFVLLNMRLALVAGITPNLQVVIAFSCWVLLRSYTGIFGRDMMCIQALTAQEVSVAASAALAVSTSAAAGSFGSVLMAMQEPLVQRVGESVPNNLPSLAWSLGYWKLVAYLTLVGLSGALLMLPFRKMLFARPSMTFATGAAAGQLLNTLHTPAMSYHGHKQMNRFAQWSAISFVFSGYQWVFNNPACNGFQRFPTFGLEALRYTWNFDFQLPLVGLGILAPISVTWSVLIGGLVSWGLLWPVLSSKEGKWFPRELQPWDIRGVFGYRLTVAMALLLSDAMYHIVKGVVAAVLAHKFASCAGRHPTEPADGARSGAFGRAAILDELEAAANPVAAAAGALDGTSKKKKKRKGKGAWRQEALRILETDTLSDASSLQFSMAAMERALRQHIFMADDLLGWVGIVCFLALIVAAAFALPALFNWTTAESVGAAVKSADAGCLKVQHVLVAAVLAAAAGVANARGAGVTDINMADMYAKAGILAFSAWAGQGVGSAGAGLACGGLLAGVATAAVNAMYAWRAGFMTMSSPTAVFASHMIGLGMGCLLAPAAYVMFDGSAGAVLGGVSASSLTANDGYFASPVAAVFRSTAVLATEGMSALPSHALWFALSAVVVGLTLNAMRDTLPMEMRGVVPIPAAVGVVCLSGASVAVDLAVGAAARIFWRLRYPRSADAYALVVGCALIAGEGLWGLGKGLLGAFGIQSPICMTFTMAPTA